MDELTLEKQEPVPGVFILKIEGRGGYNSANILNDELNALAAKNPRAVIFDLDKLQMMPSLLLGYIVQFQSKIKNTETPIFLASVCDRIEETLEITRLKNQFKIVSNTAIALEQLSSDA